MARREIIGEYSEELVKLVRSGLSHEDAVTLVGISKSSFYRWLQRGENAVDTGRPSKYAVFFKDIRKAEIEAKARKIQVVEKAAVDDPKMALELLARKYPKEWGKKQEIGLTGSVTTNYNLTEVIEEIRKELGDDE